MNRRTALALGIAAMLPGCAGGRGPGDPALGTVVLGLRLQDTPALQEARSHTLQGSSWIPLLRSPPSSGIRFARVDPEQGGIDLPFLAGLSNELVQLNASGFASSFDDFALIPGRYVSMRAEMIVAPENRASPRRILTFSGSGLKSADASELDGFEFSVQPGETVYVGTMVLALARGGPHGFTYERPRVEDDFPAAAAAFPALLASGRSRATRLMTLFMRGVRPPPLSPAPPTAIPPPSSPAPSGLSPVGPAPSGPVPSNPAPAGPPRVPRIG